MNMPIIPSCGARLTKRLISLAVSTAFAAIAICPLTSNADVGDRPFDFADDFYLSHGVDPTKLVGFGRRTGSDGISVIDTPPDQDHRNVRVTLTLPAYDLNGSTLYWNIFGELLPDSFTKNLAGEQAKALANSAPIYVFPKRAGDHLAVGNNRQADMIDMRNGYFSNNQLGLWVAVFVNYTDAALQPNAAAKKILSDIAARNGRDLDGTPIIKTKSDLDKLSEAGLVTKQVRKLDGSQGWIWSVCPVIEDPTDGGIASDAFLAMPVDANGKPNPVEEHLAQDFQCLKDSGKWCD